MVVPSVGIRLVPLVAKFAKRTQTLGEMLPAQGAVPKPEPPSKLSRHDRLNIEGGSSFNKPDVLRLPQIEQQIAEIKDQLTQPEANIDQLQQQLDSLNKEARQIEQSLKEHGIG